MHGLPQRTGFDAGCIQGYPHGLDIAVRLAVGMERSGGVGHSGCSAHGTLNGRLIGVLLAPDTQLRIYDDSVQPVIAVVPVRGVLIPCTARTDACGGRYARPQRSSGRGLYPRRYWTYGNCNRCARADSRDKPRGPGWRRT